MSSRRARARRVRTLVSPPIETQRAEHSIFALVSRAMKLEVLYFDGCPNHEALLPRLRELLASTGVAADIELVEVEDAQAADRERFLGSPTIRINGEDVEPGADQRTDFGLKCRLFATPSGLSGLPAEERVRAALQRAAAVSR